MKFNYLLEIDDGENIYFLIVYFFLNEVNNVIIFLILIFEINN